MFINRKAQITISMLLIFVILFSVFSLGIYASREFISTANFRNAVDAAALSAGADLSKGIDLYITLVGVRLLIFGTSIICAIIPIIYPPAAGPVLSVEKTLRKVSQVIEYISRYTPVIYTSLAEVDAYKTFKKNLANNHESVGNAHLVVIPKAFLDKIINGDVTSINDLFPETDPKKAPSLHEVKETISILTKGFTVFAYRKRNFLNQGYNNIIKTLGEGTNTQNAVKKFLDNNEFALIDVYPIKRTDTGVDLSDAISINNFLLDYENPTGHIKRRMDQQTRKIKKDVKKIECEKFSGSVKSFLSKDSATIDGLAANIDNTENNLTNKVKEVVRKTNECCSQYNKCDCHGNCVNLNNLELKLNNSIDSTFRNVSNYATNIKYGKDDIDKQSKPLQSSLCGGGKIDFSAQNSEGALNLLQDISSNSGYAISELRNLSSEIPRDGHACHETVTTTDEKGNPIKTCSDECYYSFSEIRKEISELEGKFNKIKRNANTSINNIKDGSEKVTGKIDSGFSNIVGGLSKDLKGVTSSFKGFPGGNILYFFTSRGSKEHFECDCKDGKPFTIGTTKINICDFIKSFGTLGNFFCAFKMDFDQVQKIFNGDKFDLASYYSPVLDEPRWLKEYSALNITLNNDIKNEQLGDDIQYLLGDIETKIETKLKESNTQPPTPIEKIKNKVVNAGVSVILGFFTGGPVGVFASLITTVLGELVDNFLVKIMNQATNFVGNIIEQIKDKINIPAWNNTNKAFSNFIGNLNDILTTPLRLIGKNNNSTKNFKKVLSFHWYYYIFNDRLIFNEKLLFSLE